METIDKFLTTRKAEFFLLGLRGRGHILLSKKAYPDALYIDLLLPDVFRSYSARPERPREAVYDPGTERLKRDNIIIEPCADVLCGLKKNFESRFKTAPENLPLFLLI